MKCILNQFKCKVTLRIGAARKGNAIGRTIDRYDCVGIHTRAQTCSQKETDTIYLYISLREMSISDNKLAA